MKNQNDQATAKVFVDGKQAGDEILKLEKSVRELSKQMIALHNAGDLAGFEKAQKLWKEGRKELSQMKKEVFDVTKVLQNLNGVSFNDLKRAQSQITAELKKMDQGTVEWIAKNNQLGQVTTQLKKVDDQMKGITKSGGMLSNFFGGLTAKLKEWGSTVVTAFSAMAVVSFFKDAGKEAINAEKSIQQYGFAIKTIAQGTEEDVARLGKQAKDLMGIFSHEVIEAAGTKMINFGLSVREVEQIMPLMVDASAQSGKSLEELATAIDKGKESGVFFKSALGQLGVNFKDTGDKAQNFNLIVQGLTKFTGGNSLALGTNWGKLQNLKTLWNEFKETLGERFFGDTSNGILGGLTSMVKWLGENTKSVMNLIKAVGVLTVGVTVYKGVEMALALIQKVKLDYQALSLARTKAQTVATQAEIIAEIARKGAIEAGAVATEGAAVAQESLNTAVKSNPWGLVLSVIATIAALMWSYATSVNKATEEQKKFNSIMEETKNKLQENERLSKEQMMNEKMLFDTLKNEKIAQNDKLVAIGKINDMLKNEHIPMLLNEKSTINEITKAEDALSQSILNNMRLRANQIELEAKMKLGTEALMAAERTQTEALIAKKVVDATIKDGSMTVRQYILEGAEITKGFSQAWADILKDAVSAGDIAYDDNLKKITEKLQKKSIDFKTTADDYAKQAEKYQVADKKTGDSLDDLREKWKDLGVDQLEAIKAGINEDTGQKWTKPQLALLTKYISEKKKLQSEGERADEKYTNKWEDLQDEMKTLAAENFSEKLSEYDKEIKAVNEKYDKLIAAEKRYISDVGAIKDPATRAKLQPNVDQAGANIVQLEKDKNEQLNKVIINAAKDLAKDVNDINQKVARAQMSILDQQLYDIKKHYDDEIKVTYDALETVKKAKLDAIASETSSDEVKRAEELIVIAWYEDQKLQIQAQASIVQAESDREQAEAKRKSVEDLLKRQQELYKKYHLLDENSEMESNRKAELADLELHKKEFATEELYLRAKKNLNDEYDKKELDASKKLQEEKRRLLVSYLNDASRITESLSNITQDIKGSELQDAEDKAAKETEMAGDNADKKAKIEQELANKKKEINKKYALTEMIINIAKIGVATAIGAMQAYELGPVAGAIMSGLIIAEGIVEAGLAIKEYNRVMSMAEGGDTGSGFGDPDETGYRVAGKVHEREYVIPAWQRKDPWVANVEKVIEAHRVTKRYVSTGSAELGVGSSESRFDSANTPALRDGGRPSVYDDKALKIMEKHTAAMEKMVNEGVKGKWVYSDFKKLEEKVEKAMEMFSK